MSEFKVGDMVKCISIGSNNYINDGQVYKVLELLSNHSIIIQTDSDIGECSYVNSLFELVKGSKVKAKQENPIRYLVYGTGCDNKSKLFSDEKDAKDYAKEKATDSDWSGDVLVYKMTPIAQAEVKTVLKTISIPKKQTKVLKKTK